MKFNALCVHIKFAEFTILRTYYKRQNAKL
jgi:hypothetical protein